MKVASLVVLLFFAFNGFSQKVNIDSLTTLLNETKYDTVKIDIYNVLCSELGTNVGDLDTAKYYVNKSYKMSVELGYKKGLAKAISLKGIISYLSFDYDAAINQFSESLVLMKELGDVRGVASLSNNLGVMHDAFGNYDEALKLYEESLKYAEKSLNNVENYNQREVNEIHKGIAGSLVNIGTIYENRGRFDEALEKYEASLKEYENIKDTSGIATVYGNIGILYQKKSEYSKALTYQLNSLDLREKINDLSGIATTNNNIGLLYYLQGNSDEALKLFKKAYTLSDEIENINVKIESGINIGLIYNDRHDYEKAINHCVEALELSEQINSIKNAAFIYNNLGAMYKRAGHYEDALEYFEGSLKITEYMGDKQGTIMTRVNVADILDIQGKTDEAKSLLFESLKSSKEIGAKNETAFALQYIYLHFMRNESPDKAYEYLSELIQLKEEEIYINYFTLPEEEKILYLNSLNKSFQLQYAFANAHKDQHPEAVSKSYDLALISKSLSLKSSTSMRNAIYESNDKELMKTYNDWIKIKNQIAASYSGGEDISEKIDQSKQLEKELINKSTEFSDYEQLTKARWQDVQSKLNKDEATIEFVQFIDESDTLYPVYYAALLLKKDSKYPESIKICSESELNDLFGDFQGNNLNFVNQLYGTLSTKKTALYNKVWKPLENSLKGIKKVYVSPTGLLHKVSFNALNTGDNQFLSDQYEIQLKSSTGKIALPEQNETMETPDLLVMGGVEYNSDTSKNDIWAYLPGSLTETENIVSMLADQNLNTTFYKGKEASESNFKVSAPQSNILHIATHGYFFPDPEKIREEMDANTEVKTDLAFRGVNESLIKKSLYANWTFVQNKNPMMRSGIIMAQANDVWQRSPLASGEDGVLTAHEVSLLDLRKTQLVILSACETGLGDIFGSEGVFGLQRAFKMAGTKYLIMSLWQVPDKETSEFMQLFYQNLIEMEDISDAFSSTQKAMREKYDPYYWAAFVLIE